MQLRLIHNQGQLKRESESSAALLQWGSLGQTEEEKDEGLVGCVNLREEDTALQLVTVSCHLTCEEQGGQRFSGTFSIWRHLAL